MTFSSSSNGGGVSKSVKTVTETRNGKTVTKTVTTVKHPDGRVETKTSKKGGSRKKRLNY